MTQPGRPGQPGKIERAADIDPHWMTAALGDFGFGGDVVELSFAPQMLAYWRGKVLHNPALSAKSAWLPPGR